MLIRAIRSLQAQTYPHWRAIIYDDSTSPSVQESVTSCRSDRVAYQRNPKRLGAAQNIDQCFSPAPQVQGHYGCVLEDDNYWFPEFLASIAEALRGRSWGLMLANQRVHEEGVGLRPADETTRGEWFQPGVVEPLLLRAALLYMEGVSNGGLVWRLNSDVDLQVGPAVEETGLHEACRSLIVGRPFLFIGDAQAVWTSMPRSKTARSQESNRVINRGMQSIRSYVLATHGRGLVERAKLLAGDTILRNLLVQSLAYSGRPYLAGEFLDGRYRLACRAFGKGCIVRAIQRDPCGAFLDSSKPAILGRN